MFGTTPQKGGVTNIAAAVYAGLNQPSIDDVFSVEYLVVPLDWTDVLNRGDINTILVRVALTDDSFDFFDLPVNDGR